MRNVKTLLLVSSVILLSLLEAEAAPRSDQADSLRQLISSQQDDETKAGLMLRLVLLYKERNQLDSALVLALKAGDLSAGIKYQKGVEDSKYQQVIIYHRKNDFIAYEDAIKDYFQMVSARNDTTGLCWIYFHFGNLKKSQGKPDSALYYYRQSLLLNSTVKDTVRYLANYNALGMLFQDIYSQFDSAASQYLKAIRICQESGRENYLGVIYGNLGKTFMLMGEYSEAKKYLEMAMDINKKYNNAMDVAQNLSNLGGNCIYQKQYDQALKYYDQAMEIYKPFGEIREVIDIYHNTAVIYKEQGKYDQALQNYKKTLPFYRSQKMAEGTILTLKNIGDIYKRKNQNAAALQYYDTSLALAIESGFIKFRKDILYSAFQVHYAMGNYKKAYEVQSDFVSLQDSIFNLDKTKIVADLKLKYEKELDQARIIALEKENLQKDLDLKQKTIQRNAFLFTVIIVLAFAAFLFLYINQRRRKDRIIAQQRIRQLEEEKKLLAAKSLVEGQEEERKRIAHELHDGLGVLLSATKMQFTSIRDTSPENLHLIERATQLLEQASGDVRKISHNMMPGLLTRLGLYEAVEDLFESITDKEKMNAECSIAEGLERLPENKEIMIYRIIQEMVNNTLKHAEAKNIHLQINSMEGKLQLMYSDDGKGFDVEKMLESRSLGLKSIQSRVDFLGGKMVIDSKPGEGTRYTLDIPSS